MIVYPQEESIRVWASATSAGDHIAVNIFSSLAASPLGALISKAPSAAAERKKARLKRVDDGRDGDLVGLANSVVFDNQEQVEEGEEEETNPTGLILDLTTHNHHHLGGASAAVAAAGGGAAAAAAAAVAAAAAAGVPPAAGAVSVNAPSALAAGGPGVGGGGVGGLVGVPHHLGGLLGAAGVGAMAGPSGVGGGGVDMVHDLILDGPGATGLCGVGATTASMIGGSGGGSCIRSPSPTRLAYTSEKHPRSTFHELNMIRKHQDLCDVVINVGGSRKILAHKYVISALLYL